LSGLIQELDTAIVRFKAGGISGAHEAAGDESAARGA
jgi:hypothetical protein